MSDLRELLGDDDYEATIDKAVETAERYFNTANYTHPDEGVTRCDYGCGVQLIERTIEHVTARILEAVLADLLAEVGRLTALVEAVREIHAPEHHPRGFAYCGECSGDEFARYPCNTLDALDGRIES